MIIKYLSPKTVLKLLWLWPPYLGSGIRVSEFNENLTSVTVRMPLRFYNTNYVGSHYGGSLYSMCDPFYMFMLLHHLKDDHIVWDQGANIDFIKPGKGLVSVCFKIDVNEISQLKDRALKEFSLSPVFKAEILNEQNEVVAKVSKTLYIRRKDAKKIFSAKT